MERDILERVHSFVTQARAVELLQNLRAAELYGGAYEAARALGEDNLVAVNAQLRQAIALGTHVTCTLVNGGDSRGLAVHRASRVALFSAVVAALERRRRAGTLLGGACRPVEEAWHEVLNRGGTGFPGFDFGPDDKKRVGYLLHIQTGTALSMMLQHAGVYAAECSTAQFLSFALHMATAADLYLQMMQSRGAAGAGRGTLIPKFEGNFVEAYYKAVELSPTSGLDARAVQLLTPALQRMQRGGARRADPAERLTRLLRTMMGAMPAEAAATPQGLRTCALPGCGAKETQAARFKSCGACRAVAYCSAEHQAAHWETHRKNPACKAARQAAKAKHEAAQPAPSNA